MADIEIEFAPPLARIKLNRPDRRNAMTAGMWLRLAEAAAQIEARADALVVIVEGAGGNFSAGADIFEFETVFADVESTKEFLSAIETGLMALEQLDRPTIALMEGSSIGGGLAIGLCCDVRFCAEDAHLAVPPAKLGLLYGPVETRKLVAAVGPARAKDLLFSGRRIDTVEALAFGLIDRRIPGAKLRIEAERYAKSLTELSQKSIRGAKKMVAALAAGLNQDTLRGRVEAAALGEDFREGRRAFAEKRPPKFI